MYLLKNVLRHQINQKRIHGKSIKHFKSRRCKGKIYPCFRDKFLGQAASRALCGIDFILGANFSSKPLSLPCLKTILTSSPLEEQLIKTIFSFQGSTGRCQFSHYSSSQNYLLCNVVCFGILPPSRKLITFLPQ